MVFDSLQGHMQTTKKKSQFIQNFGLYGKIGNLRTEITLPVSSRGNSLCIIIPKDICDLNQVFTGDMIRVRLSDQYRKRRED